jgi:predicted XRE-type DNA-binding protein
MSDDRTPFRHASPIARSLALGHAIEESIRQGRIRSHTTAAEILGVTRNRVSQIVDLTILAPDIQEEILFIRDGDPLADLSEKLVRELVARHREWDQQRQWWRILELQFDDEGATPLAVCSIAQLRAMHADLLGSASATDDRVELVSDPSATPG